jgi:deoxyribodipyrimidine photo-lyase
MSHRVVLHWFRRDLRLTDNPALHAAAKGSEQVVPVYVLSDWSKSHSWTGTKRQDFLCGCLESLAHNLETIGSKLILRCGRADLEIEKLLKETQAEAVYFNRDYDPYGRDMEKKVQAVCARLGVACHGFKDRVLHEPGEVLTGSDSVYRVFTPYARNWTSLPKDKPVSRVVKLGVAAKVSSLELPTVKHWQLRENTAEILPAGERAARQRMKRFVEGEGLTSYAQGRNTPAGQTTSRLGQDLRFGLISIRELHARCQEAAAHAVGAGGASIETFIKELAWREFYFAILYHFPEVFEVEFNPEFRGMPWEGREEHFAAWSQGMTGFPLVDAGMRQLLQTGFMHNRVRMIVSMFLTKDLHCDWRLGESFFMQHLVDGENASNNGGWQWSAGTGADAAPYFRIQNPWTQTKNYDPEGAYIKTWVPELQNVGAERFQAPPKDGTPLAPGYPAPIVDHARERLRTLAIFAKHRQQGR